jgi:hypothetical protein
VTGVGDGVRVRVDPARVGGRAELRRQLGGALVRDLLEAVLHTLVRVVLGLVRKQVGHHRCLAMAHATQGRRLRRADGRTVAGRVDHRFPSLDVHTCDLAARVRGEVLGAVPADLGQQAREALADVDRIALDRQL